jgi:hypothetical protein
MMTPTSQHFCSRSGQLLWFFASLMLLAMTTWLPARGDDFQANYDEARIPAYELPGLLTTESGEKVTTPSQWAARRSEILELFEQHVFGRMPSERRIQTEVVRRDASFNEGKTIRYELNVKILPPRRDSANSDVVEKSLTVQVLVDVPAGAIEAVPAFFGLNFAGNHTVTNDPNVRVTESWVADRPQAKSDRNRATEAGRGTSASRWPMELINERGYAVITAYYGDIDPDFDDNFKNGVHGLMADYLAGLPVDERGGSIAGWAYGMSCVLDAIEQTPSLGIDASRVAVLGHSRLGKTALWAGASDPRFSLVISNDSGCGGAALSRRAIGETVGRINTSFPHWFCDGFLKYNRNENSLPVDSHQLIALAAPRGIAIGSATGDQWADPKGEFLAAKHASPVYELLGLKGLRDSEGKTPDEMPTADEAFANGMIHYHLRSGPHDLQTADWLRYLSFADRLLK